MTRQKIHHGNGNGKKKNGISRVAYFSMEYAIDQALKTYSGGLGFLAGSHLRSAYELKQNIIGVGILWKYGYYDQYRKEDGGMEVRYIEKKYSFLEDTGITVDVKIFGFKVYVKAFLLRPETFGTAPLYLLSTDIPENEPLARSTTDHLYAAEHHAKIAQQIVLGEGGAKVLEATGLNIDTYHLNEAHGLPLAFHLYSAYNDLDEVKRRLVFTTHTPEKAGNEVNNINFLHNIGYFNSLTLNEVRNITGILDDNFDHTLVALRMAKIANAVSSLHQKVSEGMWKDKPGTCNIIAITNAQNKKYWADPVLQKKHDKDEALLQRKREMKMDLIKIVANQTGNIFDPDVLTIVWARRFAEYKRANLIIRDFQRFRNAVTREERPIQIIWAGKPYPGDTGAINLFNELVQKTRDLKNCAVLVGHELALSAALKQGADIWLNTPRITREASGTSGMTAAMNGAINFSVPDGWVPEFAEHGVNSFIIPPCDASLPADEQDTLDHKHLWDILDNEIIPAYYDDQKKWIHIMKRSIKDVTPQFDSDRMANDYAQKLYSFKMKDQLQHA